MYVCLHYNLIMYVFSLCGVVYFCPKRSVRVLLRLVRRNSFVFIFHHRLHGGLQHRLLAGVIGSGCLANNDGAIIIIYDKFSTTG
jgi:hypothetical protein